MEPQKALFANKDATQKTDAADDRRTPASLSIIGATRRFAGKLALDDVSIVVAPGEFVSIIGPSGCGKSTLLRAIAGLEQLDNGCILIGDRDVRALRPSARGVAFVFQSYALYPHKTCRQNLAAPLMMQELSALGRAPVLHRLLPGAMRVRASIAQRVECVAGQLQILEYLDSRPGELSGGQRQRVALGRALIRKPKLFLLDEPLANLDAALRNTTRAELHALQRRVGATTLFVTHDQAEAMAVSDRIAVMFAGKIRQVGTPDDLYRNPVDLDVARFLSQPWLNCIPNAVAGQLLERGPGRPVAQVRGVALHNTAGVVAFRPEDATIDDETDRTQPGFSVQIERSEHAGSDANLFVRLREADIPCVIRIPSAQIAKWRPGTYARMRFDTQAAWIFPAPDLMETDSDAMQSLVA
jgi:multiple sugar transport system ATP-binding protein